jgi:TonB family protein
MRQTKLSLIAFLLLGLMSVSVLAQETKPSDQKATPQTPPITANEPKNEVEKMLAATTKRGEKVLGVCLDDCKQNPDARIEGALEKGRAISLPKPSYPALARAAHISGTVEVQVIIDEHGKVLAAAAVSGHPLLYPACVQAARNSEFTPTKLDGQPVKVTGVLQYNFVTR